MVDAYTFNFKTYDLSRERASAGDPWPKRARRLLARLQLLPPSFQSRSRPLQASVFRRQRVPRPAHALGAPVVVQVQKSQVGQAAVAVVGEGKVVSFVPTVVLRVHVVGVPWRRSLPGITDNVK